MINLAGNLDCDKHILEELKIAGVEPLHLTLGSPHGEVPSRVLAYVDDWNLTRAWYYWVAKADETPLLFKYADELHKDFGTQVRVEGHCCSPSPREWCKQPYQIGGSLYHIDTQEGLNAFVKMVRKQTADNVELNKCL